MKRTVCALACLLIAVAVLSADDHTVLFDEDVDFSAFKTFSVSQPTVLTARPELQFPPLVAAMVETIRTSLGRRGLSERPGTADLDVQTRVTTLSWAIGPYGRPSVIGPATRGGAPGPIAFTEATLVLDLVRRSDSLLVWRGVFRDDEEEAGKLVVALPKDAASLLSQYPPRQRGGTHP